MIWRLSVYNLFPQLRWEQPAWNRRWYLVWSRLNHKFDQMISTFLWSQIQGLGWLFFSVYVLREMSWKYFERTNSNAFCCTSDWQLFITYKRYPNEITVFLQNMKCVSQQLVCGLDCTNYGRPRLYNDPSVGWQLVHEFWTNVSRAGSLIASKWGQGCFHSVAELQVLFMVHHSSKLN